MATQSKFNTVLPANTIQQGLLYTPISTVYANSINTLGQAENVMTANDVELSLNTFAPGSTSSINIPASYKLLGNMYLKMKVKLSTLLQTPVPTDSLSYLEMYQEFSGKKLVYGNVPNSIDALIPSDQGGSPYVSTGGSNPSSAPIQTNLVGLGTLNTGLPMDINFLAYNLIKQFTWRIPGCDRLYIQGIRMLPAILDRCPNEEEKQKIAMMSGSGHHLYSYNMVSGKPSTLVTPIKFSSAYAATPEGLSNIDNPYVGFNSGKVAVMNVNTITDPTFVIYALLDCPWSTTDKDRPGLYYPSHMTTSALELNIQFQDAAYMRVPAEPGYSGYQVEILEASLRFTYAAVATLTYYKPPIYKLPCSLHYDFEFPIDGYDKTQQCRTNLLGLKNGEITQLLMFVHQADGSTANEAGVIEGSTGTSMRYKWRNEPMKGVQVEYAGQIIWKGAEDGYDFMNQFDNRKSCSSFKMSSLLTTKTVDPLYKISSLAPYPIGLNNKNPSFLGGTLGVNNNFSIEPVTSTTLANAVDWKYVYPTDATQSLILSNDICSSYIMSGFRKTTPTNQVPYTNTNFSGMNAVFQASVGNPSYLTSQRTSLSNFYDISGSYLMNDVCDSYYQNLSTVVAPTTMANVGSDIVESSTGIDLYKRSLLDGPFLPGSSSNPYTKICRWHTPMNPVYYGGGGKDITSGAIVSNFAGSPYSASMLQASTAYYYGDCFHWTTIPVAEKIDQIRGPRDYNLGADFKDSNLIVKFAGMDSLSSGSSNSFVTDITNSGRVRWNLHLVASITSAFIFNGDKADLMQ